MARRPSEVPTAVRAELDAGTRETANLAEALAVDFAALADAAGLPAAIGSALRDASGEGVTRRVRLAGELLLDHAGASSLDRFAGHPSDTVRSWACYAIAAHARGDLAGILGRLQPLADDHHFGVREWAWLAVRDEIARSVGAAIALLAPWAGDSSANIRRFASEATRPRGVWCVHLPELKGEPEIGLPLLEPLRADASKYVQDSVANWLNDASKTRPDWVVETTDAWLRAEPGNPATTRIAKRARRSIERG
ncbi:MAG: DNA alkylation repair protein [Planctomycetota bacterium]